MFERENDLESLRIGDFGLAAVSDDMQFKFAGTLAYMSPEQMRKQNFDVKVDIFAAGLVLFVLCSGGTHPVYVKGDSRQKYEKRLLNSIKWEFPRYFPTLARNLFFNSVKFDKNVRYHAVDCLRHPFVTRQAKKIPNSIIDEYAKQRIKRQFRGVKL